jgi:D-arabinose 1-dehydrogenase-like Zn-dependent alcohol dehydrogenase
MSSAVDQSVTFKGWGVHKDNPGYDFEPVEYHPRILGEEDVEIAIECCGICFSDLHTCSGGVK